MGRSESNPSGSSSVDTILAHIGTQPWSNYSEADYTVEQWHKACLIHQHVGPPTSKQECKLPVRTPTGVINQNAVYAATAVLAGARGGVISSAAEKASAAKTLIGIYKEMGKPPPPSLLKHSEISIADGILAHHGIPGMKWGHRNSRSISNVPGETGNSSQVTLYSRPGKGIVKTKGGEGRLPSNDAKSSAAYKQIARKSGSDALSNVELGQLVKRMGLEQQYSKIANVSQKKSVGRKFIENLLSKERDSLLSGKKGPMLTVVSTALAGTSDITKNTHRSPTYPVGALGRSYAKARHRP